MNFEGKPKTKSEQKKDILNEIVSEMAFEKHSEDEEKLKVLCSDLPKKEVGDNVSAGERFIYNGVPYRAISAHVLTVHHNPETADTHLYENILPKSESGIREFTAADLPLTFKKNEIVIYNGEEWRFVGNGAWEELTIYDSSWLPPFHYWQKIINL